MNGNRESFQTRTHSVIKMFKQTRWQELYMSKLESLLPAAVAHGSIKAQTQVFDILYKNMV